MFGKLIKICRSGTFANVLTRYLKGPFQSEPYTAMARKKSYSDSHKHKSGDYHTLFIKRPGTSLIWDLEKEILSEFIKNFGPFGTHLDFAGGTGRIAAKFEDYCDRQVVLDISDSMLSVARKNLKKAEIICRDFSEDIPEFNGLRFNVVTAFRFFANAEPDLRESAFRFISDVIEPGGWLIVNNHRNFWSLPYIASRWTFTGGHFGMTNRTVIELAENCGFSLQSTHSIGVLPQSERKALFPWAFVRAFEALLSHRAGALHRIGYNVVFFFRRQPLK
jgi:ubiquinone/menaquinone biosynthesis C-methylase UbiE